jgi:hypothetical protein
MWSHQSVSHPPQCIDQIHTVSEVDAWSDYCRDREGAGERGYRCGEMKQGQGHDFLWWFKKQEIGRRRLLALGGGSAGVRGRPGRGGAEQGLTAFTNEWSGTRGGTLFLDGMECGGFMLLTLCVSSLFL